MNSIRRVVGLGLIGAYGAVFAADPATSLPPRRGDAPPAIDPAVCEAYAGDAVAGNNENLKRHCGYAGPRWQSDVNAHLDWCRSVSNKNSSQLAAEQRARSDMLDACLPELKDTIWGTNAANQVFRWTGTGWKQVAGELKHVSIGSDGSVWGVNSRDQVYRWSGTEFKRVPNGALKQVDVKKGATLWGVNAANAIFRWGGVDWKPVIGELKYVSVGGDGTVWGVNSRDEIYRWTCNTFRRVAGSLMQLSVRSGNDVWGVNAANEIFRRAGSGWEPISGELKHVSAGANGEVWGVNSKDEVYRWTGNGFKRVPFGALKQVAVKKEERILFDEECP